MNHPAITTQAQFNRAVRQYCTAQVVKLLPYVLAAVGSIGIGLAFGCCF